MMKLISRIRTVGSPRRRGCITRSRKKKRQRGLSIFKKNLLEDGGG